MRRLILLVLAGSVALISTTSAQQAALKAAADALGVSNIRTLQFTGSGSAFQIGQNFTPTESWPPVLLKTYTATINYDAKTMRVEQVRDQSVKQPRGGGAVFNGAEQRQIQLVSGDYAWNVPVPPPAPAAAAAGAAPSAGGATAAPAAAPGGGQPSAAPPPPAPAAAAWEERMLALWATPHGFIKAAVANNASTKKIAAGTEVSFTIGGKYKMTGLINARNQIVSVKTWIDQPLVGDMLVETQYTGYYDFGGVVFPTHILQRQDGFPTLDLAVASVVANPPVEVAVPDNVRTASPPAVTVNAQKLADGVFYLTGGTHHSLAVEMKDHIVLVDTPNNEQRGLAVIAKTKELVPNKPIRFLVTSHHHWDHLSGIRAAMAEGATIVTSEKNKAFIERVAKAPHTLKPDRQAAAKKPVTVQTVGAKGILTDGTRTVELYTLSNYLHAGDMLIVYLPNEKILAEADAFTPPAAATASLSPLAVPYAQTLYDNIQRLRLDVQTIAPFHGARTAEIAELAKDVGRSTTAPTTR
jgi:glyoxylase-like metal-dependent hydrolase (beta-lactamase superfamily II)